MLRRLLMTPFGLSCGISLACLMLQPSLVAAQESDGSRAKVAGKGVLYIAGGGTRGTARFEEFVSLVRGDRVIAVFVAADSDGGLKEAIGDAGVAEDDIPEEGTREFERMVETNIGGLSTLQKLKAAGISDVIVMHTRSRTVADSADFADRLDDVDGIWFVGGYQSRYSAAYEGTRTLQKMHKLLQRGGVIGGSSAGASIQGDYHLGGGKYKQGFRFLTHSVIGQHIDARDRETTSIVDILSSGYERFLGIGIGENTAVEVKGDSFSVKGTSYVFVYHPSEGMGRIDMLAPGAAYNTQQRLPDLNASASEELKPGVKNTDRFGLGWLDSRLNTTSGQLFHFHQKGKRLPIEISATGHLIDSDDEVELWLNGRAFGHLAETKSVSGDGRSNSFPIPAHYLQEGVNTVLFKQDDRGSNSWGVTDLLIKQVDGLPITTVTLDFGKRNEKQFGHRWPDCDVEIRTTLFAQFINETKVQRRVFSVTGYDIDQGREVEVFVNGHRLGSLSKGADKEVSVRDRFTIPAQLQLPGQNEILIRQCKKMIYPWGVQDLLVE